LGLTLDVLKVSSFLESYIEKVPKGSGLLNIKSPVVSEPVKK
jgi:hypothetical protein